MKFNQFQFLTEQTFGLLDDNGQPVARFSDVPAERLNPLVLAYIGDAYFNLYVRGQLLYFEQSKVRVLHDHGAKMVSATLQAFALRTIEQDLTDVELDFVRRGRNAKSTVPKSASVADYRYSTGFEALLGYLYLTKQAERLDEIVCRSFAIISRKLSNSDVKGENT